MNRIQLACYGLMTSAFVLGGLLLYVLPSRMDNRAEANMVVARENFTLMTARSRAGEESLYVLENSSQKLLIYTLDMTRKRLEPTTAADLAAVFRTGAPGGGGGGGGASQRAPR
jgi:hypothetical protein